MNRVLDIPSPRAPDRHTPRLIGISYELGEESRNYLELEGRTEALARYRMVDNPALWGWGQFHKTQRPASELALASARKTLAAARLTAGDIGAVILCSTSFPAGDGVHLGYCNTVLGELALFNKPTFGMTLNRCGTLLSAISVAADLVAARREAVLVICADVIANEPDRFQNYAILSDSASSCVVTADGHAGYGIVHKIHTSAHATINDTGGGLAHDASQRLLAASGNDPRSIGKVFHDNLFLPVISMREQMAGFSKDQLYLDNIAAVGHCFASDSLINLATYRQHNTFSPSTLIGLVSGTPGLRTAIFLHT